MTSAILGVRWIEFVPYVPFSYVAPSFTLLCAFTGIGIWYVDQEGNRISRKAHSELYPGILSRYFDIRA
jgi:Na+/H+ antiporter NhaC